MANRSMRYDHLWIIAVMRIFLHEKIKIIIALSFISSFFWKSFFILFIFGRHSLLFTKSVGKQLTFSVFWTYHDNFKLKKKKNTNTMYKYFIIIIINFIMLMLKHSLVVNFLVIIYGRQSTMMCQIFFSVKR